MHNDDTLADGYALSPCLSLEGLDPDSRMDSGGFSNSFDSSATAAYYHGSHQHLADGATIDGHLTFAERPSHGPFDLSSNTNCDFSGPGDSSATTVYDHGQKSHFASGSQNFSSMVVQGHQLITPPSSEGFKTARKYTCCFCDAPFKRSVNVFVFFKRHISQKHSCSQHTFHCPDSTCSSVFLESHSLESHMMSQHRRNIEAAELSSAKRQEPHPSACAVCQAPTSDWESFFDCLREHFFASTSTVPLPSVLSPRYEDADASHSEMGPASQNKRKRINEEQLPTENLTLKKSQVQHLTVPCDTSPKPYIDAQQEGSPVSFEYSSSASDSKETDITQPDPIDDSIDAGIIGDRDLSHILDSSRYFSELDQLELATARALGMETGPISGLTALDDCIDHLKSWKFALAHLQSQGFCGPSMSILVEEQGRDNVAEAFPISLANVEQLLGEFTHFSVKGLGLVVKHWIQKMLNLNEAHFVELSIIDSLTILCSILSVGLLSFSGSHVCPFDANLWSRQVENIPIGLAGYSFRPRKLACLDEFIGGPAWVLGKTTPNSLPDGETVRYPQQGTDDRSLQQNSGIKVSLSVQQFDELWGPISLVGGFADHGLAIRTERGFILPLPQYQQSEPPTSHNRTIECHWTAEIPQHIFEGCPRGDFSGVPVSLQRRSKLLIGTAEIGLSVNEKCRSSISSIQQQIAGRLQYPGTCKAKYVKDGLDLQFGGGQYVTGGLVRKYKRMPKRTLRAMLLEDCKNPNTKLVPLLGLRVGLEVSACTGNAQRVTLWDALRLSQTGVQASDNALYCEHKIGDRNCISTCWTRYHSSNEIDSFEGQPTDGKLLSGPQARRIIINSLLALEHTGLDSEGNLQVAWPFSDIPAHCPVLPSTPKEANNWLRVVKETRETCSFPIFSQRCLEFHDQSLIRSCSAPYIDGHAKPLQTILSTQILTLATDGPVIRLLEGARLLVGEAHLTITKKVQGQVAIIATVSMNPLSPLRLRLRGVLPDAPAHGYKENIRPDISVGLSVPVYVH
ncbi:unnamed protein product [Penicillium olsonii]|uniref:C2H2-type domain-containing protein n=1 Tax=Penicillium olsonii TaxID=99116 RepID=A0A9W4HZF4_PENOL|nr:unnamed protein product [Penicillium olsonii]CAG8211643.1 unnamed protein product [Penicillium olsonii]